MTQLTAAPATTLLPSRRSLRPENIGHFPRQRRMATKLLGWLANLLASFAVVIFLCIGLGPHLFGYRTETMLTGSMAPKIEAGDVVVAWKIPAAELKVGDIISYRIPVDDHKVLSHRVVQIINNADGTTAVRTKGDANKAADPWLARIDGYDVWQVRMVVPYIGTAIRWLRQPGVAEVLHYGAPAVVVLLALGGIWQKPKELRKRRARHAQEHP